MCDPHPLCGHLGSFQSAGAMSEVHYVVFHFDEPKCDLGPQTKILDATAVPHPCKVSRRGLRLTGVGPRGLGTDVLRRAFGVGGLRSGAEGRKACIR